MLKPLAAASLAVLSALVFSGGFAAAEESSTDAVFSRPGMPFSFLAKSEAAGTILYESRQSDAFAQPWDAAIIEGRNLQADVTFEFSRQDGLGNWSAWVAASNNRFANGRFWARAVFPLGSGPLRFRVLSRGANEDQEVFILHVEVVQIGGIGEQSNEKPAPPEIVLPAWIYSRKDWHAAAPRDSYELQVPVRITIHHSEGPQTVARDESEQEIRFIQDWHKNGRGWSDIGYHFIIDGAGNIFEGRPANVVGANVKGYNDGNIGVVLMGDYQPASDKSTLGDKVTPVELGALVKLIGYLSAQYGIKIDDKTLRGHRDYEATLCPGDNVYSLLPTIIQEATQPQVGSEPTARLKTLPPALAVPTAWDGR